MAIQFYNGKILFVGGAIAMHADCCCSDCTCDPDALPTSITIDLTNADFSGCSGTACSPDDDPPVKTLDALGYGTCEYLDTEEPPTSVCWNGILVFPVQVVWTEYCRWAMIVNTDGGGVLFVGPNTPNNPTGTYTPAAWYYCATGTIEVT
jgi:hypothetical protein